MPHLDEGQLHSLLDGELDQVERQAAEAHLAACAECRQDYEEAKALLAGANELINAVELPRREPPAADTTPSVRRPFGPRFNWRTVAWAASLVLAVGLGWLARPGPAVRPDVGADTRFAAEPAAAPVPAPVADSAAPADRKATATPARSRVEPDRVTITLAETTPPRLEHSPSALNAAGGAPPATPAAEIAPADRAPQPEAVRALTNAPPTPSGQRTQPPEARDRADQLRVTPPIQAAEKDAIGPGALLGKAVTADEGKGYEAAAVRRGRSTDGFQPTPMESAVRILGGSIRLVDGLTPTKVLVGRGGLMAGGDERLDVVRVVYMDPPGRELWLDQQRPQERLKEEVTAGLGATTLLPGDTLLTPGPAGATSLKWVHQTGFRLALTGYLPADSLRALARRVQ